MSKIVEQDAWIPPIFAMVLSFVLVLYPVIKLGQEFPDKTLIEYKDDVLGKFFGKIAGILYLFMLFQFHAWTLRGFGEMMITLMPGTPMALFSTLLSVVVIYAVSGNIEVIIRTGEIIFPIGIFSLVLVGAASYKEIDISNLMPVMNHGFSRILLASIPPLDWFTVPFAFAMFTKFIKNKKDMFKISLNGVLINGIILIVFITLSIVIFGPVIATNIKFPLFRIAQFGNYQSLLLISWVSMVFMRASLLSYSTVIGITQYFKFNDYKFLIVPENILAVAYSFFQYENYTEIIYYFNNSHLLYILSVCSVPLLLWIVSMVKKIFTY